MNTLRKLQGFDNEYLFVLPRTTLQSYQFSNIIMNLYITDLGFFPNAKYHYVNRGKGTDSWIIIFCTNGAGTVEVDKKVYQLHQYSLIILPPRIKHCYYASSDQPWDIYWVHFRGKTAKDYPNIFLDNAFFVDQLSKEQTKLIMRHFWLMINALIPGFSYNRLLYISQLLGTILATLAINNINDHRLITGSNYADAAIQFIYKHINEAIKIADIADSLDVSESYLSRKFHAITGTSIVRFITATKMDHATHYLKYTNIPIQQIAAKLGYKDSYYFSRVFKKQFKVAPRNFRKYL